MSAVASIVAYDEDEMEVAPSLEQMPEPTGYRMLVAPLQVKAKTDGGIYLPDERRDKESEASMVMKVISMGSDCYNDTNKFPDGAWCAVGDWILVSSYAGVHIMVNGIQFRILNDDNVIAVVEDPRGIGRA